MHPRKHQAKRQLKTQSNSFHKQHQRKANKRNGDRAVKAVRAVQEVRGWAASEWAAVVVAEDLVDAWAPSVRS